MASMIVLLMLASTAPAEKHAELRIEAIKYGLGAVASGGALAALLLAVRRQRLAEQTLHHQQLAQAHTEMDAAERRVTDLYFQACEQLGSANAPVRLASLYALERLAQDNPAHRQTVVAVICAYLRMPFTPPEHPKPSAISETGNHTASRTDPREELQVRLAAQRVLIDHLGAHGNGKGTLASPAPRWDDVRIDLTGATLVDFDLSNGTVADADFYEATFINAAVFTNVNFTGVANFAVASFSEFGCYFNGTAFRGDVYFGDTSFNGGADFRGSTFSGDARFGGVAIQPTQVDLAHARVTNLNALLEWPPGWTVNASEEDGVGWLVRIDDATEVERDGDSDELRAGHAPAQSPSSDTDL